MSILDPKADAQALDTILVPAEDKFLQTLQALPAALGQALQTSVAGLTITIKIDISKK